MAQKDYPVCLRATPTRPAEMWMVLRRDSMEGKETRRRRRKARIVWSAKPLLGSVGENVRCAPRHPHRPPHRDVIALKTI